jgi:hypothetical protein
MRRKINVDRWANIKRFPFSSHRLARTAAEGKKVFLRILVQLLESSRRSVLSSEAKRLVSAVSPSFAPSTGDKDFVTVIK